MTAFSLYPNLTHCLIPHRSQMLLDALGAPAVAVATGVGGLAAGAVVVGRRRRRVSGTTPPRPPRPRVGEEDDGGRPLGPPPPGAALVAELGPGWGPGAARHGDAGDPYDFDDLRSRDEADPAGADHAVNACASGSSLGADVSDGEISDSDEEPPPAYDDMGFDLDEEPPPAYEEEQLVAQRDADAAPPFRGTPDTLVLRPGDGQLAAPAPAGEFLQANAQLAQDISDQPLQELPGPEQAPVHVLTDLGRRAALNASNASTTAREGSHGHELRRDQTRATETHFLVDIVIGSAGPDATVYQYFKANRQHARGVIHRLLAAAASRAEWLRGAAVIPAIHHNKRRAQPDDRVWDAANAVVQSVEGAQLADKVIRRPLGAPPLDKASRDDTTGFGWASTSFASRSRGARRRRARRRRSSIHAIMRPSPSCPSGVLLDFFYLRGACQSLQLMLPMKFLPVTSPQKEIYILRFSRPTAT